MDDTAMTLIGYGVSCLVLYLILIGVSLLFRVQEWIERLCGRDFHDGKKPMTPRTLWRKIKGRNDE